MCDFASEYQARHVDNSRRTRERYDATNRPRPAGQAHLRVFLVNMIGSAAYPDNLIFVEIRSLIFIIGIRKNKIQTVDACDLQVEFQPLETFS